MMTSSRIACCILALAGVSQAGNAPEITLEIRDYATMPMTGAVDGKGQIMGLLARINFMREEPGGANKRFFVNDLNGPLYILDQSHREVHHLSRFQRLRTASTGLFHKLPTDNGFANGFISFAFDPDYAHNGKFYTIHLEDPELPGSAMPDNAKFPRPEYRWVRADAGFETPGPTVREAVLIEWTDSKTSNTTFEGTARELMRLRRIRASIRWGT